MKKDFKIMDLVGIRPIGNVNCEVSAYYSAEIELHKEKYKKEQEESISKLTDEERKYYFETGEYNYSIRYHYKGIEDPNIRYYCAPSFYINFKSDSINVEDKAEEFILDLFLDKENVEILDIDNRDIPHQEVDFSKMELPVYRNMKGLSDVSDVK